MIYGSSAWLIQKRLLLFIFVQMLKVSGNPVHAFKGIVRLRKLRRDAHGNKVISKFVKANKRYYWVTDFPGFPTANLKYILQGEFERQQNSSPEKHLLIPQQTLIWGITNRCALRCSHCYDWDNIDTHEHLNSEQLHQILQKIEEHGIRHVQLSGGEPLARFDDLISILNKAADKIDFWLLTSGFGLTAEKAKALKEAGLRGVNISLDHWDEEQHNLFRNNAKSYSEACNAVKHCREAGILVSLSLCATREFISEENLQRYARQARNMGANFIRILEPRAVGHFSNQNVQLRSLHIQLISSFMKRMNSDPEYKEFPIVVFFGFHQRKLGCMGAGNRYMYIDANGEIHACPFCRGSVGNVFSIPLNTAIAKLRDNGCQAFKMYSENT